MSRNPFGYFKTWLGIISFAAQLCGTVVTDMIRRGIHKAIFQASAERCRSSAAEQTAIRIQLGAIFVSLELSR
jgi:hypothetical protein